MDYQEIANKIVLAINDILSVNENRIVTSYLREQLPNILPKTSNEALIATIVKKAREKETILKQNGHTNIPILFEEAEIVNIINNN